MMTHTQRRRRAFGNARPCSIYYGQIAAKYQADFKTPLPKFQGQTLPYALVRLHRPAVPRRLRGRTRR